MNITQLKKQKINCTRINENYTSNEDLIEHVKNDLINNQRAIILDEVKNFTHDIIYYIPDKVHEIKYYCNNRTIEDLLYSFRKHNPKANILDYKVIGDFLHITAKNVIDSMGVMLKNNDLQKEPKGMIEFRACGDYIFHYIADGVKKRLYGEKIKANQLVDNVLTVHDFYNNKYQYILEK